MYSKIARRKKRLRQIWFRPQLKILFGLLAVLCLLNLFLSPSAYADPFSILEDFLDAGSSVDSGDSAINGLTDADSLERTANGSMSSLHSVYIQTKNLISKNSTVVATGQSKKNLLIGDLSNVNTIRFLQASTDRVVDTFHFDATTIQKSLLSTHLAGYQVVIPEQVLISQPGLIQQLLEVPDLNVSVLATDELLLWPLRLDFISGLQSVVIQVSPTLGLTVGAFANRDALEILAASLILDRIRVIPLVSREDPMSTLAFIKSIPEATNPPKNLHDALNTISGSKYRFLVITGHVEENAFVVRSLTGQEEYRVSIDEIYRKAAAAKSEVLLLGCGIGRSTTHTGPLGSITANDVIGGLRQIDPNGNALTFLDQLSKDVGPLIVQDDHHGGFLVSNDTTTIARDFKWKDVVVPVQMVLRSFDGAVAEIFIEEPVTWGDIFYWIMMAHVFILLGGWIGIPIARFWGPTKIWNEIKNYRSSIVRAGPFIPEYAVFLYIIYGPVAMILSSFVMIMLLFILLGFLVFCFPGFIAVMLLPVIANDQVDKLLKNSSSESRPDELPMYIMLVSPLIFFSGIGAVISYVFVGPEIYSAYWGSESYGSDTIILSIGIAPICLIYALLRFNEKPGIVGISALFSQYIYLLPFQLLFRLERLMTYAVRSLRKRRLRSVV